MKALILKDFFTLRANIAIIFAMLVAFAVGTKSGEITINYGMLMLSVIIMNTFSYDEKNKWSNYAIALPYGDKRIVLSRYVAGIMLIVIGAVVHFVVSVISLTVKGLEVNIMLRLLEVGVISAFSLLMISINIPIFVRFNSEKGVLYIAVFMAMVAMGFSVVVEKYAINVMQFLGSGYAAYVAVGVIVGLVLASAMLSVKLFKQKKKIA